ncbi:hypothetical protein GCM10010831_17670 [Psychroflexus salis]|uniref:Uncharacterized protein n=1 Tax=Psychroflexus salis TaxID=1526574 RepID=A0A916ZWB7_9FLAO|nr:hypothetical protein GCM10010831_17670 [Psychroflexus salis]
MKKTIIKELFWFVMSALIALILAFVFLGLLNLTSSEQTMNSFEKLFTIQLYIVGWIVSFITIYIFRIVIKGIIKFL